jgi:hypothetical protein
MFYVLLQIAKATEMELRNLRITGMSQHKA